MREEDIPDLNIFMMCTKLNTAALRTLPSGYTIRSCRPDELGIWKAFPFDTPEQVKEYDAFMTTFFHEIYSHDADTFFKNTLFVCDENDRPVATCAHWNVYGKFQTIHWLKTLKSHEGKGLGRALMSVIMKRFTPEEYPVFLHTQPGSFRAIKLYSDFGFHLLSGKQFGSRENHLEESLPILQRFITEKDFQQLKISEAPASFMEVLKNEKTIQF